MNTLRPLSAVERMTLRRGQTAANLKYSIGGRLKEQKPPRETTQGRTLTTPTAKQAVGVRDGNLVKLVCAIDHETFDTIRCRAVKAKTSVAEQVRLLLEWGLEADHV